MAKIYYADLWGLREGKYRTLSETDISISEWKELKPDSPFYFFIPRDEELSGEYEQGWKVTDVFGFTGEGFTSHRDNFAIALTEDEVKERLDNLVSLGQSDEALRQIYGLDNTGTWRLVEARKLLRADKEAHKAIRFCLYRPFDKRFCLLHLAIMDRPRMHSQAHMMKPNLALATTRRVEIQSDFEHILCVAEVMDRHAVSLKEINYLFPLYLYPAEGKMQFEKGRRPNFNPEFIKAVSEKLGLKFVEDGKGDLVQTFGPEDIFNYAYAVFHSPTYRSRYAGFLRIDFPRLPLTSNKELFKALVAKGAELVAQHLMESPTLNNLITKYPVPGSNTVEKVSYDGNNRRVYINKSQYFEGVESEVWNFQVGGYQVCHKWLKDRKGITLTYDDLTHYQKIVIAIKETIRLMKEIDSLIPSWPME